MKTFTINSPVVSDHSPQPERRHGPQASSLRRQRRSADQTAANPPAPRAAADEAPLLSVAGRAVERPRVLLYKAGESYASRSPHRLKRTVVNTELPLDLLE